MRKEEDTGIDAVLLRGYLKGECLPGSQNQHQAPRRVKEITAVS